MPSLVGRRGRRAKEYEDIVAEGLQWSTHACRVSRAAPFRRPTRLPPPSAKRPALRAPPASAVGARSGTAAGTGYLTAAAADPIWRGGDAQRAERALLNRPPPPSFATATTPLITFLLTAWEGAHPRLCCSTGPPPAPAAWLVLTAVLTAGPRPAHPRAPPTPPPLCGCTSGGHHRLRCPFRSRGRWVGHGGCLHVLRDRWVPAPATPRPFSPPPKPPPSSPPSFSFFRLGGACAGAVCRGRAVTALRCAPTPVATHRSTQAAVIHRVGRRGKRRARRVGLRAVGRGDRALVCDPALSFRRASSRRCDADVGLARGELRRSWAAPPPLLPRPAAVAPCSGCCHWLASGRAPAHHTRPPAPAGACLLRPRQGALTAGGARPRGPATGGVGGVGSQRRAGYRQPPRGQPLPTPAWLGSVIPLPPRPPSRLSIFPLPTSSRWVCRVRLTFDTRARPRRTRPTASTASAASAAGWRSPPRPPPPNSQPLSFSLLSLRPVILPPPASAPQRAFFVFFVLPPGRV